jgi:hypothetical protein
MKIVMKIIIRIVMVVALLFAGFAAGFPIGRSVGFSTGSEWAILQADLLAREAGMFMPINYEEGKFRIIIKQPRHLYKRAWQLADRHDHAMQYVNLGERALSETLNLQRNTYLTQ